MRPMKGALLLTCVFAACALWGCGMSSGVKLGQAAVDEFHLRYNERQFDAIYDSADPEYLKAVDRDTSRKYFEIIHEKLGPCSTYSNTGYKYEVTTSGTFIDLHYSGTCASGTIEEDFHLKEVGKKALIIHYKGDSPTLMQK